VTTTIVSRLVHLIITLEGMLTPDFTVIQAAIIEVKCPQRQPNNCQSLPAYSDEAAKKLSENFIELMWERLALIRGNHRCRAMPGIFTANQNSFMSYIFVVPR
jgi:hypothetical protein